MKVSIVTPSFNQGSFIERTLRSVLTQDWESFDYVVFDGGSTDCTIDILKRYSDRLRWVSGPDGGQADAVNKGISATTGDLIGWINSDDIYYPGAIRTVAEYFGQHPQVDVVYGMADHIDINDVPFEPYPTEAWNFDRLKETCFICQPALFFRRSIVTRFGLLDTGLHYCMDYEYWLRLGAGNVRFAYLPEKLAGSRMYADNKTMSASVDVHAEINTMLRRQFGRVPDRWLYNYAHVVTRRHLDQSLWPRRFVVEVAVRSVIAAFRWNRGLSPEMQKVIWSWLVRQIHN